MNTLFLLGVAIILPIKLFIYFQITRNIYISMYLGCIMLTVYTVLRFDYMMPLISTIAFAEKD